MWPAASVSGYYIGHPQARYFGIGKLGRDQVEDYAKRKGVDVEQAEKWLAPNLGYRPEKVEARSEEHTSELQSLMRISYAVFCLKKKTKQKKRTHDAKE